jgi:hypothetical protein
MWRFWISVDVLGRLLLCLHYGHVFQESTYFHGPIDYPWEYSAIVTGLIRSRGAPLRNDRQDWLFIASRCSIVKHTDSPASIALLCILEVLCWQLTGHESWYHVTDNLRLWPCCTPEFLACSRPRASSALATRQAGRKVMNEDKKHCTRPGPVIQSSCTARLRGVNFSLARHGSKS